MNQTLKISLADVCPQAPDTRPALRVDLRFPTALAVRGYLHFYHRIQIQGRENLPQDGSFILVANHTSHWMLYACIARCPCRGISITQRREAFLH